MKRLIIIEGNDNSGKDTLINNLREHYKDYSFEIFHAQAPNSTNNLNAKFEQNMFFRSLANKSVFSCKDIVVHNRSWYGEYVYGVKYRERDKNEVIKNVHTYEKMIEDIPEIYYVQLISDPKILVENEDGQSISEGDIDKIKDEIKAFKEIFKESTLENKKIINVTKKGEWKTPENILKEVIKFIESSKEEVEEVSENNNENNYIEENTINNIEENEEVQD